MFFCGIDVAKRKHVAVVMDAAGNVTQRAFSVANTCKGMNQVHQCRCACCKTRSPRKSSPIWL